MNEQLRRDWEAILASRRNANASGQDGPDLAIWLAHRAAPNEPEQLMLFPAA